MRRRGHTEAGVGECYLLSLPMPTSTDKLHIDNIQSQSSLSSYSVTGMPQIDLCYLTNLPPAAALCELVNDDLQGSMARRDDCRAFANKWGLKMISIEDLVRYRKLQEGLTSSTNGTNGINGHSH